MAAVVAGAVVVAVVGGAPRADRAVAALAVADVRVLRHRAAAGRAVVRVVRQDRLRVAGHPSADTVRLNFCASAIGGLPQLVGD